MTKIEENVVSSKKETGKAKKEMQKAVSNDGTKTILERIRDRDSSVVSVFVCFVIAIMLFLYDVSLVN